MDESFEGRAMDRGQPVDGLALLDDVILAVSRVLAGIASSQRRVLVPDTGMDVEALALELIYGLRQLAGIGLGTYGSLPGDPPVDLEQMALEYRHSAEKMRSVWHIPGVIDSDYEVPWGHVSGVSLIDMVVLQQVSHGRELALATGQSSDPVPMS